jgi:hypothetical protein
MWGLFVFGEYQRGEKSGGRDEFYALIILCHEKGHPRPQIVVMIDHVRENFSRPTMTAEIWP